MVNNNFNVEKFLNDFFKDPFSFFKYLNYQNFFNCNKEFWNILKSKEKTALILAHRNSYKTTIVCIFIAFWSFFNPHKSFLLVRKTERLAQDMLYEITKIFQTDFFRMLYYNLYNQDLKIRANKTEIYLPHSELKREANLVALGMTANLTGLHFDYIFLDDIVSEKDRYSIIEREKTKKFFYETQNILKKDGFLRLTGTIWHKDDLFNELINKNVFYKKFDVYQTSIFDNNKIIELKNSMPYSLFACNYELRYIANENALVKEIKYYNQHERQKPVWGHLDVAFGGGDTTAVTVIYISKKGKIIVRGHIFKNNIIEEFQKICDILRWEDTDIIFIEKNTDKGYIANELRKNNFVVKEYHEAQNKHFKITTYILKNWANIYISSLSDAEYCQQIMEYSVSAKNDDAPDSLASLLREMETQKIGENKEIFFERINF